MYGSGSELRNRFRENLGSAKLHVDFLYNARNPIQGLEKRRTGRLVNFQWMCFAGAHHSRVGEQAQGTDADRNTLIFYLMVGDLNHRFAGSNPTAGWFGTKRGYQRKNNRLRICSGGSLTGIERRKKVIANVRLKRDNSHFKLSTYCLLRTGRSAPRRVTAF